MVRTRGQRKRLEANLRKSQRNLRSSAKQKGKPRRQQRQPRQKPISKDGDASTSRNTGAERGSAHSGRLRCIWRCPLRAVCVVGDMVHDHKRQLCYIRSKRHISCSIVALPTSEWVAETGEQCPEMVGFPAGDPPGYVSLSSLDWWPRTYISII